MVKEKFINDTIYVGTEEILGAYFDYNGKDVYGFLISKPDKKKRSFSMKVGSK